MFCIARIVAVNIYRKRKIVLIGSIIGDLHLVVSTVHLNLRRSNLATYQLISGRCIVLPVIGAIKVICSVVKCSTLIRYKTISERSLRDPLYFLLCNPRRIVFHYKRFLCNGSIRKCHLCNILIIFMSIIFRNHNRIDFSVFADKKLCFICCDR